MQKYLIIFLIITSFAIADNVLINGAFEEILDVGWEQTTLGSPFVIDRATHYDPDPDYEACVIKSSSNGYAKLYQIVDIPSTNIDFSCNARLFAYANTVGDWAGAAIILSYMNESEVILGETRICDYTSYSPWINTSTLHLIEASDASWHYYSFNIDDELTNLSGVNPAEVVKINVALFDTSKFCGG